MRYRGTRLSLLLVAGVIATAALAAACQDDSSSPGTMPSTNNGPSLVDAGASNEGGPPATPPKGTGVTVTVHVAGVPSADVAVFLHDEAGATTGDLRTDANGIASAPTAPKQLTIVSSTGPISYLDVEEGDTLFLDLPGDPNVIPPPIGTLSVTIQGKDGVTSGFAASAGNCFASAEGAGVPFDVPLHAPCVNGSKTAVLAIAYGGTRGIMYQLAHDVALPGMGQTKSIGFAGDGNWNEDSSLAVVKLAGGAKNASSSLDYFYDGVRFGMGLVRAGEVTDENGEQYATPPRSRDTLVGVEFEHSGQTLSHSSIAKREILGTSVDLASGNYSHTFQATEALAPITEATVTLLGDRFEIKAAMSGADHADLAVAQASWRQGPEGSPPMRWTFVMNPAKTTRTSPVPPAGFLLGLAPGTEIETSFAYFDSSLVGSFAEAKKLPFDPALGHLREPLMKDTSIGAGTKSATVRLSMVGDLRN